MTDSTVEAPPASEASAYSQSEVHSVLKEKRQKRRRQRRNRHSASSNAAAPELDPGSAASALALLLAGAAVMRSRENDLSL